MMTWDKFCQSVSKNIEKRPSPKAIWLKPSLDRIPLPIQRFDEPFLPLSKAIVKATKDYVAIYIFDLASYISIGAAGIVALERAIAYTNQEAVTVLHGPFSGKNYGVLGEDISLNVDALTVTSHEDLNYYTTNPPYGAFLFNGSHVKKGGTMNNNTLTLCYPEQADIIIDLIDTDIILQDLTETYIDAIKASVL
jgi:hypothetical protein